ncbi:MAG: hypothetical protein M3446_03685 [Actinomycetota bacterium]|nr:hypothetical protein [Actinomycetota bacterium]
MGSSTAGVAAGRSPSIRMAVLLIWSLIGLLAVRTLLTIVLLDSLLDEVAADRTDTLGRTREYVEAVAPAYVPIALISLILFGGLLAVCAIFVGKGARWARITAIVLSVLVLLGALIGVFAQPGTILFLVINILVAITAVGIIYYLLRPDAKAPITG